MLDANSLPPWSLIALAFGVAFLYSSVGLGGGSGYLAAMSLFAISTQLIASTALTLNILVASIAFVTYWQSGYFDRLKPVASPLVFNQGLDAPPGPRSPWLQPN